MNICVSSEHHFRSNAQGEPVSGDGLFGYTFWQRFLHEFDTVTVVARQSDEVTEKGKVVTGDRVRFVRLPDYCGLNEYIKNLPQLRTILKQCAEEDAAFLVRLPGSIGSRFAAELNRRNKPYGVEVIGDPWDVFARGVSQHRLRFLLQRLTSRQLRGSCWKAECVSYVNSTMLPKRYPVGGNRFWTHFSSIDLPEAAFRSQALTSNDFGDTTRMVTVANPTQTYKGLHILIDALAKCVAAGQDVTWTLIGDGRYRAQLEAQAADLNLTDRVRFLGKVAAGAGVREKLAEHNLFVLPSLTEGLPRALIEAMATGLPSLATRIGGIPELLDETELVTPGSVDELAHAIQQLVSDKNRLVTQSARNLKVARDYHEEVLQARRNHFYRHLLTATCESTGASVPDRISSSPSSLTTEKAA